MDREKVIVRTSMIGILLNVVLVFVKLAAGMLANSIAIILDAINNLSDALSSLITIVGTKLAGKKADNKHPYGYGRIEYLTGAIIAVLVLMAGFTSLKESIDKIIHPEKAEYQLVTFIIVGVAVIVKLLMGLYVKNVGKKVQSGALEASGTESLFDAVLSAGTIVAAVISILWNISLEAYFGAVIAIIIIKAGIEILMETLGSIIGTRAEQELVTDLKQRINAYEQVQGTYDVTLHNYGPNKLFGSVHVEVADELNAAQIHALTRKITMDIFVEKGILLTVGIYATNLQKPEAKEMHDQIQKVMDEYQEIIQFHGFYLDETDVSFDLVIDFGADIEKIRNEVIEKLQKIYPNYRYFVAVDTNFSD